MSGVLQLLMGDNASVASGLLLDTLSATAIGAYSTRKLRTAYAGKAIRVYDSFSGGHYTDIGFSGNNLDTTALLAFASGAAGNAWINTYYDQSGSGNNLVIAGGTGGERIIVSSNVLQTVNSNAAATSPLLTGTLLQGTFSQAQPDTIALVAKVNTWTSGIYFCDGVGVQRQLFGPYTVSGNKLTMYAGTGGVTSSGTADTNAHGYVCTFQGVGSQLYQDGTSILTCDSGALTLATENVGANQSTPTDGYLPEVIFFSSAIGSTDIATLHTSWQTYWGIP